MMKEVFRAVRVTEDVWWVGAIDWNIRDFHGYQTRRGSTYNAYLILADKITLIDTVKAPFREEMMARIASVIDPGKIDYIVSNHSEMDHSGSLPEVIRAVNPGKVFASAVGAKTLKELFPLDREITAVKDGETLSLGNRTLTFLETRMLHWPDSMFAYLNEEQLLFSQDAFGMHYASTERFADECDPAILAYEAATYYANIILPYSPLVLKLIEKVTAAGLSFRTIAPDHGPIWRKETGGIIGSYAKWAAQKPEAKAVVVYATMWHSTEMMARAISEGLAAREAHVDGRGAPERCGLRTPRRRGARRRFADAQQPPSPEHGGYHDLSQGVEAEEPGRRRLRILRLERGGGEGDRRDPGGDEGREGGGGDPGEECAGCRGACPLL
jgi:flavorubredoxin